MDEVTYFENIASFKMLAKKEVGQNFLVDVKAARTIVEALEVNSEDNVLEIGCGAGSLTYFLEKTKGKVTAIDIDEAMLTKTGNDFKDSDHLSVIYGNAAKYDYRPFTKIIGNLPYYITTLILEKVLLEGSNAKTMVFMVQKEAGERIGSKVGDKDYSPLSILLGLCYTYKRILTVGRASFVPAPHVESAVYTIKRKEGITLEEGADVYLLAKSMFLQRRKTLRNNLKGYLHDEEKTDNILSIMGLKPTIRPEEVTPEQYLKLTRLIKS